jgi:Tfp pilus assembly protein PilN
MISALLGAAAYSLNRRNYNKDITKKRLWSAELAQIKKKVDRVTELDNQKNFLNAKKNIVVQLLQGRILYPILMEHIFEILPSDIWISDLGMTEGENKSIIVEIKSESLSMASVANWLQTLESKTDRFSGVDLSAIDIKNAAENSKLETYSFTLKFTYRPPVRS